MVNIHKIHDAILDAYRYDTKNSLPNQVKNSPFWSLMHENISKFGSELNGGLRRGVSAESLKPIHAPHALRRMKGGVNAYDVVAELFDVTSKYLNVKNNAFLTINKDLGDDEAVISEKLYHISSWGLSNLFLNLKSILLWTIIFLLHSLVMELV